MASKHTGLRPMLAARMEDLAVLKWPLLASNKLDGIRALVKDGVVVSRTLKPIRNAWVQRTFGHREYDGLDGELILPNQSFRDTTSVVMTSGSQEKVDFCVFDLWNEPGTPFIRRQEHLREMIEYADEEWADYLIALPHMRCDSWREVEELEERALTSGFEGLILRDPHSEYKFGRSTMKEQGMIKVKRFQDAEAVITGATELMRNQNEAVTDALGYTKRSSSQNGKVPAGMLGTLEVRNSEGVEFEIGSGFDVPTRILLWEQWKAGHLAGKTAKYKFQPYGGYDRPRQPIFLGLRHEEDL